MVQAGDRSGPGSIGAPESFAEIRVGIRTCPDDVSSTDLRVLATACITEHGTYGVPLGLVTAGGTPSFQYTSAANRAVRDLEPRAAGGVDGADDRRRRWASSANRTCSVSSKASPAGPRSAAAPSRWWPGSPPSGSRPATRSTGAWFRFPGGVAAAEPGTTAGVIDVAAVAANTTRPARTPGASPRELTTVTPRPTRSSSTATPFAPASIPANATRIPRVSPTATRFPATATATPDEPGRQYRHRQTDRHRNSNPVRVQPRHQSRRRPRRRPKPPPRLPAPRRPRQPRSPRQQPTPPQRLRPKSPRQQPTPPQRLRPRSPRQQPTLPQRLRPTPRPKSHRRSP